MEKFLSTEKESWRILPLLYRFCCRYFPFLGACREETCVKCTKDEKYVWHISPFSLDIITFFVFICLFLRRGVSADESLRGTSWTVSFYVTRQCVGISVFSPFTLYKMLIFEGIVTCNSKFLIAIGNDVAASVFLSRRASLVREAKSFPL